MWWYQYFFYLNDNLHNIWIKKRVKKNKKRNSKKFDYNMGIQYTNTYYLLLLQNILHEVSWARLIFENMLSLKVNLIKPLKFYLSVINYSSKFIQVYTCIRYTVNGYNYIFSLVWIFLTVIFLFLCVRIYYLII